MKTIYFYIFIIAIYIVINSCSGSNEKVVSVTKAPIKKDTAHSLTPILEKAPIINLQDTIGLKQTILCIKDSANNQERMYIKLCIIFNTKLTDCIKANKIKITGNPIVWHTKQKNAFFFEAGIPVDKTPAKPNKGMYMKNTNNDSVFIAHFYGANESSMAYEALYEKLNDLKKQKIGEVYEIYFGDYFSSTKTKKDFYKLRRDIVLPYK